MGILYKIKKFLFADLRILKYKLLSTCKNVEGKPIFFHPLLLTGYGKIKLGENVQNGVTGSQHFYTHYNLLESRMPESEICIGNNVALSNNIAIISFKKVTIGNNVIIGHSCTIMDADGHCTDPYQRNNPDVEACNVVIDDNVLLYSNVTITKGVSIGKNSIIGTGSIVTKDIPANVIAAGNPARVIKNL